MRSLAARLALGASLLAAAWQFVTVQVNYGGNASGLFCVGDRTGLPAELRPSTYVFPSSDGYDGAWYRLIARDPFFQKGYASVMDDARLRYRRGLLPVLAWAVALGSAQRIDLAYIVLTHLFLMLGVYATARLCELQALNMI